MFGAVRLLECAGRASWNFFRKIGVLNYVYMARAAATLTISTLTVLGLLGSALPFYGQPDDGKFTAKLLEYRYGLSVRNGRFSGSGARVLQSAIAQSRFVLVGENHGLAETPKFWAGICRAALPEGFHTMALEEGPLAAMELERWAGQPDGQAQLTAFEKQYPESINIYNTREEFGMLQQCAGASEGGKFRLWGLNQEALGAGGLMLSRILDTRPGGESGREMRQLLQKNDEANAKALQSGRVSDLFMISASDKDLAAGAVPLQKDGSPQARSLFASLIQSHEINRVPPADYGNAGRRSRLMKTLFRADYAEAARAQGTPPKVLLKFGAYHIYRGLNPVHGSGIGNYVAEFAEGQGAQSLHICVMAVRGSEPIYPRVGQPAQLLPFNLKEDPGAHYLQPMLANLLDSDWTMFDLRPLRQALNGLRAASSELATLVFGIDILVMVPEATPSTEIR
jgi:hypothetical protein